MRPWHALLAALAPHACRAGVTVYGLNGAAQQTLGAPAASSSTSTSSAAGAGYTALPAYNSVRLQAPPVPVPPPPTQFALGVQAAAQGVPGLSIPLQGGFFGFSIEMSVVNQVSEWLLDWEGGLR